jgi:AbrB family looped-hinge helix DNA binding protein
METKSTRYLDAQGRIILPNHIRKALNLVPGSAVEVEMEDSITIRIRPAEDRCELCGAKITKDNTAVTISVWSGKKHIGRECDTKIYREHAYKGGLG